MFADRLKVARKKKKLSQVKLAEMLEVSQQTIAAWEKGIANPDIYMVKKIAWIFDVSMDYLLENQIFEMPDGRIVREEPALYGYMDAPEKVKELYVKICDLDEQQIDYLDDMLPLVKKIKYKR